ncbi:MAG: hypothetical protein ACU0CO_09940 [Shimia sp.]
MIVKIVTLFLIGIAVMAMFGRLRMPKLPGRPGRLRLSRARCRACGRPRIGTGPCPCGETRP